MPKTNLCKPREDPREAEVRALIAGGKARMNLTQTMLAKKAHIPQSTLSGRCRNPREMKLGELWDIIDILKPDQNELAKII